MVCIKRPGLAIWLVVLSMILPFGVSADEFKLTPSIGTIGEYNDNLFFDDSNEIDDFITTLFGGLDLSNRTERTQLNLSAKLNGVMYDDNDDLDDVEQFYSGRINYKITERVTLGASGGYSEDSRPDRDLETTGIVLGPVERKRWNGGLSGDVVLTEKSAAGVSYTYEEDTFDDSEFTDYEFHIVNLGFTHDLSKWMPRTVGRINAGYSYYDTDDTDVEFLYATLGFSRALTEIFTLLVDVGARYAASEFEVPTVVVSPPFLIVTTTTETENEWGPYGRIVLGYAGETTRADVTASKELRPVSGRDGTADRTSFLLNIRHRFAEKFSVRLAAEYFINKADVGKLALEEIDEDTLSIRPELSYEIIEHLVLKASYTYTRLKDRVDDTEPERNRFFVQVSYGIPLFE